MRKGLQREYSLLKSSAKRSPVDFWPTPSAEDVTETETYDDGSESEGEMAGQEMNVF